MYRPSETPFFILQIFYFMTAVFINKIMFSDWPFNIKQRSEKLSILTLRCDTTVGCASQSFWFLFKPISKIFYPVFWGPHGFYSWHKSRSTILFYTPFKTEILDRPNPHWSINPAFLTTLSYPIATVVRFHTILYTNKQPIA